MKSYPQHPKGARWFAVAAAIVSLSTCDTKPRVLIVLSSGSAFNAAMASSGASVRLFRSKMMSEGCFSLAAGTMPVAVRSKKSSAPRWRAAVESLMEKMRSSMAHRIMKSAIGDVGSWIFDEFID